MAVEAPIRILVQGVDLGVLMRTPGDDRALAAGFAVGEGILASPHDLDEVVVCTRSQVAEARNTAEIRLARGVAFDPARTLRSGLVASGCAVCGSLAVEKVRAACPPVPEGPRIDAATLLSMPEALSAHQAGFAATGGLHAAGLFDPDGTLRFAAEDVGRHNAVDKAVGAALLSGVWPPPPVLVTTSRGSFDIVQKAAMAGIPVVAFVSAPSSLAIELAGECGITLVGFLRAGSGNVYSGAARLGAGVPGRRSEAVP